VNGLNIGRGLVLLALVLGLAGGRGAALGQVPPTGEGEGEEPETPASRYKVLTGPDALEKLDKVTKDKLKPPFEFFRSGFAPFDVLPFVKARHWSWTNLEMRSNYVDYDGLLETLPVPFQEMNHAVIFRREARLLKGQQARLGFQLLLPLIPREITLSLARPDGIRADESIPAPVRALETHQMLIVILAKNPSDYGAWTRMRALIPTSGDKDPASIDRQRYYRLVIPQDADKPFLSPHPLTWTTISHIFWDSFDPDLLTPAQQQAMVDWLHWGGQITVMGGAAASLPLLKDSFLGPYLPADPAGENSLLTAADLAPLSDGYRPPNRALATEEPEALPFGTRMDMRRYDDPVPINPAPKRPVYFVALRKREGVGAVELPMGDRADRLLGVERRVGRGRITMLSFSPTDPAFIAWPGLDTLVSRLLLRRPEEVNRFTTPDTPVVNNPPNAGPRGPIRSTNSWQYLCLNGQDLTWMRLLSRDLGAEPSQSTRSADNGEVELPREPVCEWTDRSKLPLMCQAALKTASGITIPPSSFILKVMIAYVIALVPLNWLVCRFVLRRREWAWLLVPVLALGFAIGVERAAAYDMGFDSGCDEIDLLETHGPYPRGHLTRFAALFSTGRVSYVISYPGEGSALGLPMNPGEILRGEEQLRTVWQSMPVPALVGLQVQPRSLALYRAEHIAPLPGTVQLVSEDGARKILNGTPLELRDATLIEDAGERETYLGTIAPGASIDLRSTSLADKSDPVAPSAKNWLDPEPFLKVLRSYHWQSPADLGEIRLVAWAPSLLPGQKVEPKVDRHRGLTLVVAHLALGLPPNPDEPPYYSYGQERQTNATGNAQPGFLNAPPGTPAPALPRAGIRPNRARIGASRVFPPPSPPAQEIPQR
jgi:hypothetical protein